MANTDTFFRISIRSKARELALLMAYSWEQNRFQDDARLLTDEGDADAEVLTSAEQLFAGMRAERAAIDTAIDARLSNWSLVRLAVVDRALLRLGTYEIMILRDAPPKVVLNEYIELAKLYGSDTRTDKLVNGMLDRIAREYRPDEITRRFEKPAPLPTPSGGVPILPG